MTNEKKMEALCPKCNRWSRPDSADRYSHAAPTAPGESVPSELWACQQYQKIQDFVICKRLWRGEPNDKSHADIVVELATEAFALREQLATMSIELANKHADIIDMNGKLITLREQLAGAHEALRFYANNDNYCVLYPFNEKDPRTFAPVLQDCGKTALAALPASADEGEQP